MHEKNKCSFICFYLKKYAFSIVAKGGSSVRVELRNYFTGCFFEKTGWQFIFWLFLGVLYFDIRDPPTKDNQGHKESFIV